MDRRTEAAGSGGLGRRLGPFRHRSYLAYWLGVSITSLGTWLQAVAGSIYVYQLTGSTFLVGVFNFAGFIPILLFSVWGGQLSDRFDRRRIVWTTHAASMAVAAILAWLTITGAATVVLLIGFVFLLNVLWALGKPSLLSLVPNIVPRPDLEDGVALTSLGFQAGQIVGPLIAAGAMATAGAGLAFTINAVTYGAPILAMAYLRKLDLGGRAAEPRRATGADDAGRSAAAFVRSNLWLLGLLAGIVVTSTAMEIQRTVAPGLVSEKLGIAESNAGLLVAAQSVGATTAFLLFVQIRKLGWSRRSAYVGLLAQGGGVLLAAIAPNLPLALLGFGFIGLGFGFCFPVLTAAIQGATPDALRGRVMAFHQIALLGHRPLTALILGALATAVSLIAASLVWLAILPFGIVAVSIAWRRLPEPPRDGRSERDDRPAGDPAAIETGLAASSLAER